MKKIISLVLAAVLTLSLAACGTKNDSKGDQPCQGRCGEHAGQRLPAAVQGIGPHQHHSLAV